MTERSPARTCHPLFLMLVFLFFSLVSFGQQKLSVSGKVTTEDNTPLSGASVTVAGSSQGVVTDSAGDFTIRVNRGDVLVINYVGYEAKKVTVRTLNVSVQLAAKSAGMNDVVVIGYGTQRKSDLSGAVQSVSLAKAAEIPLTSVDQMLTGKAGGVQINQSSGQAGAGTSIRIRGGNSLNGTNQPLFVIDGFPIINDNDAYAAPGPLGLTNAGSGNAGQGNSNGALNWLNPADIQSVEILKDASATAIYGSRGANGVIIITTKKGKAGQTRLFAMASTGFSEMNKSKIHLLDAAQFAEYYNLQNIKSGLAPIYVDTTIGGKFYPTPDKLGAGTNWIDAITRKGPVNNYSIGFSGGSDVLFSGSVAYTDQRTPLTGSRFKRLSTRLDMTTDLEKWLTLDNSLTYSYSTADNSPSDVRDVQKFGMFEAALMANPAEPVYNSNGTLNHTGGVPGPTNPGIAYNPISDGTDIINRNTVTTFLDNLSLKFKIASGITFDTRASIFNNDELRDIYYNSVTTFNGFEVGGLGGKNTNNSKSYLIENFATVNKTFGANVFNAVAGYSYQQTDYRTVASGASGFPNDILKNENLSAGSTQYPTQTNRIQDLLSSFYARFNDVFLNKYILTFTGRYDGSSKFGSGNKWAFFPSGAFSWKVKEEDFMKDSRTFSDLKLRVSYGLSGNQAIQSLQSQTLLGFNNYPFGGSLQTGAYPAILGNPNLKWETTKQFNVGADFGLLNQRITGSINYYIKNTVDLLQQESIPANSGFSSIYENVGSISNKGIELDLHASIVNGRDFKWDIDANIAHNKQILTSLGLPGSDTLLSGFNVVGGATAYAGLIKGKPVGVFYGYVSGGIYETQQQVDATPHLAGAAPGSRVFQDLNHDGAITDQDRRIIGDPNPKFTYGITNTFTYRALDLSFLIQGSAGGNIWNLSDYIFDAVGGNHTTAALNYWTPSNTHATAPAPGDVVGYTNFSSAEVSSASFARLKVVNLGYTFQKNQLRFIKSLRIYASATNLYTITGYKGFDPEINSFAQSNLYRNIDILTVPLFKTYTIGLNVGF